MASIFDFTPHKWKLVENGDKIQINVTESVGTLYTWEFKINNTRLQLINQYLSKRFSKKDKFEVMLGYGNNFDVPIDFVKCPDFILNEAKNLLNGITNIKTIKE